MSTAMRGRRGHGLHGIRDWEVRKPGIAGQGLQRGTRQTRGSRIFLLGRTSAGPLANCSSGRSRVSGSCMFLQATTIATSLTNCAGPSGFATLNQILLARNRNSEDLKRSLAASLQATYCQSTGTSTK